MKKHLRILPQGLIVHSSVFRALKSPWKCWHPLLTVNSLTWPSTPVPYLFPPGSFLINYLLTIFNFQQLLFYPVSPLNIPPCINKQTLKRTKHRIHLWPKSSHSVHLFFCSHHREILEIMVSSPLSHRPSRALVSVPPWHQNHSHLTEDLPICTHVCFRSFNLCRTLLLEILSSPDCYDSWL